MHNYPTALISETLAKSNATDIRTAVVAYAFVALFISCTFEILYRYVYRHPELKLKREKVDEEAYFIKSDPIISVVIYIVAIITSFFSVWVGGFFLLAGIIWHAIAYLRLSRKVTAGLPKSSEKPVRLRIVLLYSACMYYYGGINNSLIGGISMKRRRGLLTMVLAAVFSLGILGAVSPAPNAAAKQTVKVVKV